MQMNISDGTAEWSRGCYTNLALLLCDHDKLHTLSEPAFSSAQQKEYQDLPHTHRVPRAVPGTQPALDQWYSLSLLWRQLLSIPETWTKHVAYVQERLVLQGILFFVFSQIHSPRLASHRYFLISFLLFAHSQLPSVGILQHEKECCFRNGQAFWKFLHSLLVPYASLSAGRHTALIYR